jgi:hypothetical protein
MAFAQLSHGADRLDAARSGQVEGAVLLRAELLRLGTTHAKGVVVDSEPRGRLRDTLRGGGVSACMVRTVR